jgi:glycosyltransferase involved in cell wall biosynthesis
VAKDAGATDTVKTIAVCEAQVPFVRGGAEAHVSQLVEQLTARGYEVERVALPFKWYPKDEILAHAAAWRLIDLSESNGRPIDLVIATKFPSYFVRHPNKVTWLIHQYRAAYELCGTVYSDFDHTELDVGLRDRLLRFDRDMLAECRHVFTNARNTAARLEKFNGVRAEALYHPPRLAPRLRPGPYGDYVLLVGRLESVKRADLGIDAMRVVGPGVRLVIAGDGTQRAALERRAADAGVGDRVTFLGTVDDEQLVDLYSGALAVLYAPYDEDYGYVTLEAFLSRKPVITARDSGGTLEFVEDGVNGLVCDPAAEAMAAAIADLVRDRARAARLGDAGYARAATVTWNGVIEKLIKRVEPGA